MPRINKIAEHTVQVEIDKVRPLVEEEPVAEQHFLKWKQTLGQPIEERPLLASPLVQRMASTDHGSAFSVARDSSTAMLSGAVIPIAGIKRVQ